LSSLVVGPFNRVEGDLEVRLEVTDARVSRALVVAPLYRGFEQILIGKDPRDALVIAPRICGICSVSQSMAAAYALAAAQQIAMPENGELATNLILACENLADHLTHFYCFFMPDFARPIYATEPWYPAIDARFRALVGESVREMLSARAQFMHLIGILAGKWPHSLSLQPGGSTRPVQAQERLRLGAILSAFRRFLERRLIGDSLESFAAIASAEALAQWRDRAPDGDLRAFLRVADALELERLGPGPGRYMSYGAYPIAGERLFRDGVWSGGDRGDGPRPLDLSAIREDQTHAWMAGDGAPLHPSEGVTLPDADRPGAYTWCKAPRLDGRPVEVGALARQLVQGHPLIRDLAAQGSAGVLARVVARLLELALVLPAMEDWARRLKPGEPFCVHAPIPKEATGVGLVEAARGSLGHWLGIRQGRIRAYQIVAPTTWNFSPRDRDGCPGPLEQALVGAPVRPGETAPVAVQHIVRSFDPCMVCTVH
jgi:uptake hydrogenase large subunit